MIIPEGQPHQFTGLRGQHAVTVQIGQVYHAVLAGIAAAAGVEDVERADLEGVDPWAIAQNACCEVEKALGIYPNVPKRTAP